MKKQTYILLSEMCHLLTIIFSIAVLTIAFYALSQWLKPVAHNAVEIRQIHEMQNYHQQEGHSKLLFFDKPANIK